MPPLEFGGPLGDPPERKGRGRRKRAVDPTTGKPRITAADAPREWLKRWAEYHEADYTPRPDLYAIVSAILGGIAKRYDLSPTQMVELIVWWWVYRLPHALATGVADETWTAPDPHRLGPFVVEYQVWARSQSLVIAELGIEEACLRALATPPPPPGWRPPEHW